MVEHLFRHQYGKMVSVLTRFFGLAHLEMIEDAVQDTFVQAMLSWRNNTPKNPEAWLMKAAKNRAIDLFRKLSAEQKRALKVERETTVDNLDQLFLGSEIEDSQLRMIFTACHASLNPKDQISFALKTISGFSSKEIAASLLLKEDTIKKRLSRARKSIKNKAISFEIPIGQELPKRLNRVLEVLYLIFNEGFHSSKTNILVRKELCGEAIRLCKLLLKNNYTNHTSAYALFALMCFQTARLDSKTNDRHEIIDLKHQDRTQWYPPLISLGNAAMNRAVSTNEFTSYHYEAAIASEHLQAPSFAATNWKNILHWYQKLQDLHPSPILLLNMAIVQLQRYETKATLHLLKAINPKELEQRAYLYYGTYAEYFATIGAIEQAIEQIDIALQLVRNEAEKQYLFKKKALLQ